MSEDLQIDNSINKELENEIIKSNIPEDKKGIILKSFTEIYRIHQTVGNTNPIIEKLNSEHISNIINNSALINDRENNTKKFTLIILLIIIAISLAFFAFVIWVFKNTPADIAHIITPIVTLIGGAIGGYGFGFKKGSEE